MAPLCHSKRDQAAHGNWSPPGVLVGIYVGNAATLEDGPYKVCGLMSASSKPGPNAEDPTGVMSPVSHWFAIRY